MAPEVIPLWINGLPELANDGRTFRVHNPLNKNVIVTSASATSQDSTVEAAGKALDAWERTPASQKRAISYGAILSIVPWSGPTVLCVRAIAVPLICGNTVVVKPSEYSPWSQEIVIELMYEAGIPPEMIRNPTIRHVNFTRSDKVGRLIAAEVAKYLIPCVFELEGKLQLWFLTMQM
ncbi:hypothetical protein ACEPAF_2306 [Sanghuangporus sanghuang]